MRTARLQNVPASSATIRFIVDGIWYEAPEKWVARGMKVRRDLGADPNEAAIDTMLAWVKAESQESAHRHLAGLPAQQTTRFASHIEV